MESSTKLSLVVISTLPALGELSQSVIVSQSAGAVNLNLVIVPRDKSVLI